jgi:hypothetical protein
MHLTLVFEDIENAPYGRFHVRVRWSFRSNSQNVCIQLFFVFQKKGKSLRTVTESERSDGIAWVFMKRSSHHIWMYCHWQCWSERWNDAGRQTGQPFDRFSHTNIPQNVHCHSGWYYSWKTGHQERLRSIDSWILGPSRECPGEYPLQKHAQTEYDIGIHWCTRSDKIRTGVQKFE